MSRVLRAKLLSLELEGGRQEVVLWSPERGDPRWLDKDRLDRLVPVQTAFL